MSDDPTSPKTMERQRVSETEKSEKTPAKPEISPEELSERRSKLFLEGSEFKPTTRGEIVGIDNVVAEVDQVIHWLRHSDDYIEYASRLEPGIIFEGDPGTGKTLVSRYIATASDALFVNVRDYPHENSLFKDSDIRDLFQRARATYAATNLPIVLFWDEFENVAVERSDATPDQIAVVSQLTAELDGIHGKNAGILLIGCTNYIHGIDKALRRSGRMGLQFEFHAPDRAGKKKILDHYIGQTKTVDEIDTETLSHFFDKQSTAADIEEACVEAWRNAVRRDIQDRGEDPNFENVTYGPGLKQDDLVKVFIKRLVGPPTTFTMPLEERIRVAIHEIGHAVVALAYGVPVRLITVQPGKKSLGRTMCDDVTEYIGTMEELVDYIRVGAGGIAGEHAAQIPLMVGSTSDIKLINESAANLIDRMSYDRAVGLFSVAAFTDIRKNGYTPVTPGISEEAINRSDKAVKRLVDRVAHEADIVMQNVGKDRLWKLAEILNDRITMTGTEFEAMFREIVGDPASLVPAPPVVMTGMRMA